jgi:hypothetical protein
MRGKHKGGGGLDEFTARYVLSALVADAFLHADEITHDPCDWANIVYERAGLTSP